MSSLFLFLYEVNERLAVLAQNAEETVWSNPRSTLLQGRLFGEEMATYVSQEERVEPVYSIKQVERLQKLSQQEVISNDIRSNFEWLRMNGNAAAHDAKDIPIDLALTAHRQMFELASWFAELYGPLALSIPTYRMLSVPGNNTTILDEVERASEGNIKEQFEKLLNDQLEARLLPTLDVKFRELQDTFLKFAGSIEEWSGKNEKPSTSVSVSNTEITQEQSSVIPAMEQTLNKVEQKSIMNDVQEEAGIEIFDYLKSCSLDMLDKRRNGGALWIIGGWELKDELFRLKPFGFHFRFARNGSQSTKRKPAWFLTGKDPTILRMINLQEMKRLEIVESNTIESDPEAEKTTGYTDAKLTPKVSPDRLQDQEGTETGTVISTSELLDEQSDNVNVPLALRSIDMDSYTPSKLSEISQKLGITTFQEWTEERLRELYRGQPKLLHSVLVQLWFFGFQFQGDLSRFIKLEQHITGDEISGQGETALNDILPIDVVRLLERYGIRYAKQLNGIPLRSLEWLLRSRFDETINLLKSLKAEEPPLANMEDLNKTHDENVITIHLLERSLIVPESLASTSISQLDIRGCPALISGLHKINSAYTVRELPSDLTILAHTLRGVGVGALGKFYNQLEEWVTVVEGRISSTSTSSTDKDISAVSSGRIVWKGTVIELTTSDVDMRIEPELFPKVSRVVQGLHERSMTKVGDLPTKLEQLLQFPGVGIAAVDKFVDQLQVCLKLYNEKLDFEQEWQGMTHPERVGYMLRRLRDHWSSKWSEDEVPKNRNMQMLYYRWNEGREGRKVTLEQTGQVFGLTRERVRQILRKVYGDLHADVFDVQRALLEACDVNQLFFKSPIDTDQSFEDYLLSQVLENQGPIYLEDFGWWTTWNATQVEETSAQLIKLINDSLRGLAVPIEQVQSIIQDDANKMSIPLELSMQIVMPVLKPTTDNRYILANSKKYEVVEMVLREYPNGIEIYKRAEEMLERALVIMPDQFDRERDITSIFSRDEYAETAYLWGRGTFIHHSFVEINQSIVSIVDHISAEALQLLEHRSPISIGRLFGMFEEQLISVYIPNEYALYTLLRKVGSDKLALLKFPHIWHADDAFQLTNAEQIKMFIREQQEPQSLERLREEFVHKRGWKSFTLSFSISTDTDFVNENLGIISLREFYPLQEMDLDPLVKSLSLLLDQLSVVHVNRLWEKCRDECMKLGIKSGYLLYDLLQGMDDSRFRFVRYPLISSASRPLEDVTLQTIIEQFIAEEEAEVPREVVYQWLTEEVGASETTLDMVLGKSEQIFYYTGGQFGEYIHRDRLGWTKEHESKLIAFVSSQLSARHMEGSLYVTVDGIWEPEKFPVLAIDLPWTKDLFIDCLRKSGCFRFIGSYDNIVVRLDEEQITNETEWIAHLLMEKFEGRIVLKQLQHRLAHIRYSKDGKFLIETLTRLENEEAPFVVVNDVVTLR